MPDWKQNLTYTKDPGDEFDYPFDFASSTNGSSSSDALKTGETIASYSFDIPVGLTLISMQLANSNTTPVAWIGGGTAGQSYTVTCKVTTSSTIPRKYERSIVIFINEL